MKRFQILVGVITFLGLIAVAGSLMAKDLPPAAAKLMKPMPIAPHGQVVPGYPKGAPSSPPSALSFTDQDMSKLKAGDYTAAIVMHTMNAGWPKLQVEGIKKTLKKFDIKVKMVTNAHFKPNDQISDLDKVVARNPDVIFSIPIDPKSQAAAFQRVADNTDIKMIFMDNVPVGMKPGKDYVTVVASSNYHNGYWAGQQLVKAIGGCGKVGVVTLVYDYYWTVAVRTKGAIKAFHEHPCVDVVDTGDFKTTRDAYQIALSMLTSHPDIKGIFAAWDTPAMQVVAASKSLGKNIKVTATDLAQDSALYVARGDIHALGAQRPYDQGVAEAKAAAAALLGKDVPPYIAVPGLRVKKANLLSALKVITKNPPPKTVVKVCDGKCY